MLSGGMIVVVTCGRGPFPPPLNGGGTDGGCALRSFDVRGEWSRISCEDALRRRRPWPTGSTQSRRGGTASKGDQTWNKEVREERGTTYLPDHDTGVPALRLRLLHARPKSRGVHEPVGGISRGGGLADDELVEGDAILRDLEEGGSGECPAGAGEEARAVSVQALVVELHVVLWTSFVSETE